MKNTDPLEKLIKDHEKVSEFLDDFREIMDFLHDEEAWRKIKPIEDFLKRRVLDHFEFEEKNVFPACLLKIATPELIKLILELQKEHGIISLKTEEFLRIASRNIKPLDKETSAELSLKGREILDLLLIHASKEDDKLIPVLEKNKQVFNP